MVNLGGIQFGTRALQRFLASDVTTVIECLPRSRDASSIYYFFISNFTDYVP